MEAAQTGGLIGHPVEGVRVVLTDGASHAVDSSEMAFKIAALSAFRHCYEDARPRILEPVMSVEITVPTEFQGTVIGNVNRRKVWRSQPRTATSSSAFSCVALNPRQPH